MQKIPKGLADSEMLKGYVEKETAEQKMLRRSEKLEKERQEYARQEQEARENPLNTLIRAGFTPKVLDALGKAYAELKLALYRDGVHEFDLDVKRDGQRIVLVPKSKEA